MRQRPATNSSLSRLATSSRSASEARTPPGVGPASAGVGPSAAEPPMKASIGINRPPRKANRANRCPPAETPTACTPPSTCTISPVVAGNQSDSSATQARAAASGLAMSQPSGARCAHTSSNFSKPGIDLAAIVFSGPAATRLTRTRCGPRSRAR